MPNHVPAGMQRLRRHALALPSPERRRRAVRRVPGLIVGWAPVDCSFCHSDLCLSAIVIYLHHIPTLLVSILLFGSSM